jgi:hypothetical protein
MLSEEFKELSIPTKENEAISSVSSDRKHNLVSAEQQQKTL